MYPCTYMHRDAEISTAVLWGLPRAFSLPSAALNRMLPINLAKYKLLCINFHRIVPSPCPSWTAVAYHVWKVDLPLPYIEHKATVWDSILFKAQTLSSHFMLPYVTLFQDHLRVTYMHSCFIRLCWSLWVRLLLPKCLWNHFWHHGFASCATCLTIKTCWPSALGGSW